MDTTRIAVLLAFTILSTGDAIAQNPQNVAVAIADIQVNNAIVGTVTNMPADLNNRACVVVFVQTNIWYIHPYANVGPGQSFAWVVNGTWRLPTVQRQFPANRIAAILLRDAAACQNIPTQLAVLPNDPSVLSIVDYDLRSPPYDKWYRRL